MKSAEIIKELEDQIETGSSFATITAPKVYKLKANIDKLESINTLQFVCVMVQAIALCSMLILIN